MMKKAAAAKLTSLARSFFAVPYFIPVSYNERLAYLK